MFPVVEDFLKSNLSQEVYSQSHGLTPRIISYWLGKYRQEKKREIETPVGTFLPVRIESSPETMPSGEIRIFYPNGVAINFSVIPPVNVIRSLVTLM